MLDNQLLFFYFPSLSGRGLIEGVWRCACHIQFFAQAYF